jgi:hypothetical protein
MQNLYDRDFYRWTVETAAALREGRIAVVDLEHVAEEVEDLGKRDLRGVISRLQRILEHKLKLELIEGQSYEFNERKWRLTISEQQRQLELILRDSPSLKARIPNLIAGAYTDAAAKLLRDHGIPAPEACPWPVAEILA